MVTLEGEAPVHHSFTSLGTIEMRFDLINHTSAYYETIFNFLFNRINLPNRQALRNADNIIFHPETHSPIDKVFNEQIESWCLPKIEMPLHWEWTLPAVRRQEITMTIRWEPKKGHSPSYQLNHIWQTAIGDDLAVHPNRHTVAESVRQDNGDNKR